MRSTTVANIVFGLVSTFASAQEIPLSNWTVPPYRGASASGGLSTMVDVTPGTGFVGVAPCRLVDTRLASFPAGFGPPSLNQGQPRNFDLNSQPNCPGIPAGVEAYSLNITVTNTLGAGFILIYPEGGSQPPVSTLNYLANETVANAAIVPAGTGGGVTVIAGVSGTNLIIDINGYFTAEYNPGVSFRAISNNVAPAILAENNSSASDAVAIRGVITTTTAGPTGVSAVQGFNQATNASGVGVWGKHNGGGWGVLGESATGFGVVALTAGSAPNAAVWARTSSTADNSSGVYGSALGQGGGSIYGVFGETFGSCCGAAGILGVGRGGRVAPGTGYPWVPGVRGESYTGFGVLGLTVQTGSNDQKAGAYGLVLNTLGNSLSGGYLGYSVGSTNLGVVSDGPAHVAGNLTVTGNFSSANKFFIEPHPHDASKEIRYVSLEGPHAEVYFRGTAQVSRGLTRIDIPQDFRFVADPQTYSAVVTPLGAMATVAVLSQTSDGIVVQASRDVKVNYVVYAERAAVKNPNPIAENVHFRPLGDLDVFGSLPDSYRRLLVQNGTLNPDGTVNRETATRLGWEIPEKGAEPITRVPSD